MQACQDAVAVPWHTAGEPLSQKPYSGLWFDLRKQGSMFPFSPLAVESEFSPGSGYRYVRD